MKPNDVTVNMVVHSLDDFAVIAWIDVSKDACGLPPWEAPAMIAEKRKLFFPFFSQDAIKQKLDSLWRETAT